MSSGTKMRSRRNLEPDGKTDGDGTGSREWREGRIQRFMLRECIQENFQAQCSQKGKKRDGKMVAASDMSTNLAAGVHGSVTNTNSSSHLMTRSGSMGFSGSARSRRGQIRIQQPQGARHVFGPR